MSKTRMHRKRDRLAREVKEWARKLGAVLDEASQVRGYLTRDEERRWDRIYEREVEPRSAELRKLARRLRQLDDAVDSTAGRPLPRPKRWGESVRGLLLHEGAHAVLAHACGVKIQRISIDWHDGRPTGRGRVMAYRDRPIPAIARLAGPVAEGWGGGFIPTERNVDALLREARERGDRDFLEAEKLILRSSGDGRPGTPRTMRAAWNETVTNLRRNWSAVEAVADAIAEAPGGAVSGRTVHRICREHGVQWWPSDR